LHVNYEYILAGLVLLLILSVSEMNIYSIMTHQLAKMEQETEYPAAARILDTILLSPGYPPNWGNQTEEPTSFGLAVHNSLRAYVLDISKASRLIEGASGYIKPGKARQLMGLSEDYHFNLTIIPVFTIDIVNASQEQPGKYIVTITDSKGFGVPNVNVTGFYVPESMMRGDIYPSQSAVTGVDGTCVLTFSHLSNCSLVVLANQLEIKAVQTEPPGDPVRVEGGYVMKSNFEVIQTINYATGSVFALSSETASRYVEIDGLTYYVEFDLWR